MATGQQVDILPGAKNLADSFYSASSVQDLAHYGPSAPDYLGKVIDRMRVSSLPIYDCFGLQLDVLLSGKALVTVEGQVCLH
jgi:hypothetical protein